MTCINAVAYFDNTKIKGTVTFHQCNSASKVIVNIDLYDLEPNKTRAIHIHEFGDERLGCISLGGHWNPTMETHGTIDIQFMPRHAGDLINNIYPDNNGVFKYVYEDDKLNLIGDVNNTIIGRSVVVHDGIDDLGLGGINPYNLKKRKDSLENGNAGSRMACAIIGIAKSIPL
tara:strand:- start:4796 stop:5314 length:519 start_codon:yes stop_codon:yes gene_type:complete